MIEAQIKKINLTNRTVTVSTQDNQELTLTFPRGANIEVMEPTTLGTMGGDLEDLKAGYFVQVEVGTHDSAGKCSCASLICKS